LQFKGKLAYPLLSRLSPGSISRFISEEEAEFLNIALEQVMQIAPKVKEDSDYLFPIDDKVLVLKEEGEDNQKKWVENWIETEKLLTPGVTDISIFSKQLPLLKKFQVNNSLTWAADMYFIPEPVVDKKGDTPFFPLTIILVDLGTEMILSFKASNFAEYKIEVQKTFIEAVDLIKRIPGKIVTIRPELFFALAPFQKALGIEMVQVGHIPAVENIKKEFLSGFKGFRGKHKK